MDFLNQKEFVLIIFIIAIIFINFALFSTLKKNRSGNTVNILKKSVDSLKNPFQKENEQMNELSNLVQHLNNNKNDQQDINVKEIT
jgi:hypothetical protein